MAAATQGAFCVTSDNVINVSDGTPELTPAQKEILTQPLIEGSTNATPYPVVKDGEGELVISGTTGNMEITNPLVVREGTLTVDGVSIDSKSPFSNFVPYLSVGGKNATLKLDNGATVSHELGNTSPSNYCGSMSLGTADGAAKVVLDNGSTLHTDHFIIAGDPDGNGSSYGGAGTGHTKYTYEDLQGTAIRYTGGDEGPTTIDVQGGSTLSAGTSLQFADVTVNIQGDGSQMVDNTRNLAINTPDCGSYFGYERSSTDGVTTEINITEGGAYICNWNLSTGGSERMDEVTDENRNRVSILVSGKDAETGAASSISVAGHMALGGNLCPGETPDSDSHTTLTVENGGVAYLNVVTIGGEGYGKAEMTVGEGSYVYKHTAPKYAESITGPFTEPVIIVGDNGSLTNAGTMEIDTVLNGGVFTMLDKAVAAGLTTTSGELNICGNVTFTGNVTVSSDTILTFDLGSTLNLDGSSFSFEGGMIYVELGSVNAEGLTTPYFTMGYTAEGSIFFNEATFIQLVQNGVEVGDAMRLQVGTNVATKLIPEPASATLSLAALMMLCARRRRKN